MDIVYKLFKDYILDKSKSLGKRFGMFLIIVIGLLTTDRITNFTYDIHVNNKINAIEKINQQKKEFKNDLVYFTQLNNFENEYKYRKHYYDYIKKYTNSSLIFVRAVFSKDKNNPKKSQETNNTTKNTNHIRSDFWMFISANFNLIILGFFIFMTAFFIKENRKNTILGLAIIFIMNILLMLFFNWLSYFIPVINNYPLWNYLINFGINILVIFAIAIFIIKNKST